MKGKFQDRSNSRIDAVEHSRNLQTIAYSRLSHNLQNPMVR